MDIVKKIILSISALLINILKGIYFLIVKFYNWIIVKYNKVEFESIYISFLFINLFIYYLSINNNYFILVGFKLILVGIQTTLLFLILFWIINSRKQLILTKYIETMFQWSCAAYFGLFFNSVFIMNIYQPAHLVFKYLAYIAMFLMLHYGYRRVITRFVNHWIKYSIYFIILPLVSLFLWSILGDTLSRAYHIPSLVSDRAMGYMTILFTVLLLNYEIYVAPIKIRKEVKVAVYLVLAVYSTISYCFFITDNLSELIFNMLKPYREEIIQYYGVFSRNMIRDKVELVLKWVTLPYLIGTVFGCFTLELVDRNDYVKNK